MTLADWLVWMAVGLGGLLVALVLLAGVALIVGGRWLRGKKDVS